VRDVGGPGGVNVGRRGLENGVDENMVVVSVAFVVSAWLRRGMSMSKLNRLWYDVTCPNADHPGLKRKHGPVARQVYSETTTKRLMLIVHTITAKQENLPQTEASLAVQCQ
jgi:hypothetical protein